MSDTLLPPSDEDRSAVEAIVRNAGTSFYHGMRILPPDRRGALYAIYAFCRVVDDIADEPGEIVDKRLKLTCWRSWVRQAFTGVGHDPLTRMLAWSIVRFDLREPDFLAIIDGMQTDAEQAIVAPSLEALDTYCDQVAAAVGRLAVRAFGEPSPSGQLVAWHLGRALQWTNILRDVAEDAKRGRLYLPAEWLTAACVPCAPSAALVSQGLEPVCRRMAAQAHQYFADAFQAMTQCQRHAMRPARIMAASYLAVLERLEQRGWSCVEQPVSVSRRRKLWIALRHSLA